MIKNGTHEDRHWASLENFFQDVRYAFRQLRKNLGFALICILTLALGIGANTAIFSVVDAALLRPLPFKEPGRLLLLSEYNRGKVDYTGVPYPDYLEWKNQNHAFEETAAYLATHASDDMVLGLSNSADRVRYSIVTNSFFSILGVQPALGRAFLADEEKAGNGKVFLISDALWRRSFGADLQAIGKTFQLDGEPYTLVGVMPAEFQFPQGYDLWTPMGALSAREMHDRISHPFHVLARLRRGIDLSQAQVQIDAIERQLGEAYPDTAANWRVRIRPLLDEFVGNVRVSLLVLLGAVGFVLLIACANVVNLMLARASAREQEFAIRAALGAGRARLLRQSLTESLLIVAISAVVAMALAKWGLALIVSLGSIHIPRLEAFQLNAAVLAFAMLLLVVTTFLVGLAPALQVSGFKVQESLREGQRTGLTGVRRRRFRNLLVISEVALTLLLLCGAGLMLKSFLRLREVQPGFDAANLLTMKIALPGAQYPRGEQTKIFLDRLLERLRTIPGVIEAGATTTLPLSGEANWGSFNIVGRPVLSWGQAPAAEGRGVSANYFRMMGIPLLRGRDFRESETDVRIVNQAMAAKYWPGKDPIGQHIKDLGPYGHETEIIGIVANVRELGLDAENTAIMYSPYRAGWYMNLVLRSTESPASLVAQVRRQLAALDKGVPIYQVATMEQWMDRSVAPHRANLFLFGLFAALALVLAAVGTYGVLAYQVSQRTHEIGVRLALGAQPRQALRLVIGEGAKLALTGVAAGTLAALGLTRLMASLLYQVSATDPLTFAAVAVLLTLVAVAACYMPARKAMRIDPLVALRYE